MVDSNLAVSNCVLLVALQMPVILPYLKAINKMLASNSQLQIVYNLSITLTSTWTCVTMQRPLCKYTQLLLARCIKYQCYFCSQ